jgi:hypothetical protein
MSDKGRKRKAAAPAPKEPKKTKKEGEPLVPASGDCTICFDKYDEDYGVLGCAHTFCFKCIESWSQQENSCPLCKARFTFIDRITPGVATTAEAAASSSSSSSAKKPLKAKRVKIKKRDQRHNYMPAGNPYAGGLHLFNLGLIVPHLFGQNMIFNMMNMPQGLLEDDDENDDDYNDNDAMIEQFVHEDNDDDDEDIDNDPFYERICSILDRGHSSSSAARGFHGLNSRGRGSTNNPIDLSSDGPAASRSHSTSSRGRMQQARRRTVSVPRTSQSSRQMSTEVIDLTGDDDESSVPAASSSSSAAVQAPPAASSSSSSAPAPQQQVSIEHDSSMSSQQLLPFVQSSSSSARQVSAVSSVDWLSSQPPLRNSGVFSAGRQERLIGNGRGPRFPADSPSSHFANLSRLRGHRPAVQQASDNQVPIVPGNTFSSGLSDDQERREEPARSRRVLPVSFSIPERRASRGHRAALGTSRVRGSTGSVNGAPVPPIPNTLATSEVSPSSSCSNEVVSTPASSAPAANPHSLWDGFDD